MIIWLHLQLQTANHQTCVSRTCCTWNANYMTTHKRRNSENIRSIWFKQRLQYDLPSPCPSCVAFQKGKLSKGRHSARSWQLERCTCPLQTYFSLSCITNPIVLKPPHCSNYLQNLTILHHHWLSSYCECVWPSSRNVDIPRLQASVSSKGCRSTVFRFQRLLTVKLNIEHGI